MFDKIIAYSVENKFVVCLLVAALSIWGVYSMQQIPIDAVPDITNNQIQIITISPTLATQEVEQFITTPIELVLQNLQNTEEIRSISRFGLSVVTVVFEEGLDVYLSRQLVGEKLIEASEAIPEGWGTPEMAPISTGLGEIYQYVVIPEEGFEEKYSYSELRSFQDWIVKRQLSGIPGVAEVNSMGGYLKQYEIAIDPTQLKSMQLSIADIYDAVSNSNENTGGAYIEKSPNIYYIRSEGLAKSLADLENIVVNDAGSKPILVKDVATVKYGKAPRYGALVYNGKEAVGGKVMMFKGANSAQVTEVIKERVMQIQKSLPEGVKIEPYLVRDKLIKTAIGTVKTNLIEGGLIVVFILILMLGNWRAGLIVASVIPLAMMFAISMMNVLGISANLMSLGAIDFGLIVDGAVIIVESIVHRLQVKFAGKSLSAAQMNKEVINSSQKIRSSAAFGEIIILMVYIPILALVGIEGKMFKPMAQTVMLAITGALILSLTYVPMMAALFLNKNVSNRKTIADRIISFCQYLYRPVLNLALRFKVFFLIATLILFGFSVFTFNKMGGEFIPTLEEGDLAMQHILPPGSSLSKSVETAAMIENKLLKEFPEITDVVANIGSAEIPTDPMPVEIADYTIVMKPKSEWTSAKSRYGMFRKFEESLHDIPGIGYEFTQPIQLRFNELMTGTKADIAIKLYGEDLDKIYAKAKEAEAVISQLSGVGSVNVEQTIGMPQVIINYDYAKLAQYGLHIKEVNQVVRAAFAGEKAGVIYEGEKRFDLVIRLDEKFRREISDIKNLYITLKNGTQIPLNSVATIALKDAPMQISRDNTNRRIVIGVNVGDSDVESLVGNIQKELDEKVALPSGYYFTYGGQFENLQAASRKLMIAVPLALALIFILLYFTFNSFVQASLIFTAIPLSAIGGIWALELRGMPFSISAGIGFIALFGVAVLNGIVLIGYFNQLKKEGVMDIKERILEGTSVRLRPVLMTAAVASLGFLPMALSNSGGAEVQRPLATVVIGGLVTATFLTLIILPILYSWFANWQEKGTSINGSVKTMTVFVPFLFGGLMMNAQQSEISLENAIEKALSNHPSMRTASLKIHKSESLQGFKYNLGTTDIHYNGDGLFRKNGQRVGQISVVQNFPNPKGIKALNKSNENLLNQSKLGKQVLESELILQVQKVYFEIQYNKSLQKLYQDLISMYATYLEKAEIRFSAGDTNPLEKLNIQSQMNEYSLLEKQVSLAVSNLEQQFQVLLNAEKYFTTKGELEKQSYETSNEDLTLWLQNAQQKIAIEKSKIDLIQAEAKPGFNIGYAAQRYYEDGWLNGLQAGISIPLFNNQNKKKVDAQRIEVDIVTAEFEVQKLAVKRQLLAAQNSILLYEEGLNFYQSQMEGINPEIERVTRLNYEAGALSYLELLNTLRLLAENQKHYLEQLLAYNHAIAAYQFLSKNK